jgi:hypothetical protein
LRTLLDLSNFILQFVWLFLPVCLSRRLFLVVHRDRKKGRFSRPSRVRHLVDGFWFAVSCHLLWNENRTKIGSRPLSFCFARIIQPLLALIRIRNPLCLIGRIRMLSIERGAIREAPNRVLRGLVALWNRSSQTEISGTDAPATDITNGLTCEATQHRHGNPKVIGFYVIIPTNKGKSDVLDSYSTSFTIMTDLYHPHSLLTTFSCACYKAKKREKSRNINAEKKQMRDNFARLRIGNNNNNNMHT